MRSYASHQESKDILQNISLIIPTKNEGKNLSVLLPKLPLSKIDDVIFVDANSNDGTTEILLKNQVKNRTIRIIRQLNKGKGNAMIIGAKNAKYENLVFLDADGSMDPHELYEIASWLHKGYHVVKGSRFLPNGKSFDITPFRRAGNIILTKIANLITHGNITDLCYGYFGIKKDVFFDLKLESATFNIEAEIFSKAMKKKYRIKEIPSYEYPRIYGVSNLNWLKDGLKIFFTILKSSFYK